MNETSVVIVGAGAAGLFCAGILSKNKINCILLEKNSTPGKKIIISGGGRCNFTNLDLQKHYFFGESQNFHWNILKNYTNNDFIELVKKHKIPFYEKKLGQLFCKNSSKEILDLLLKEIDPKYVQIFYSSNVTKIEKTAELFEIYTKDKIFTSNHCVVSSGGLPMPAIGGSNFGIQTAHKFAISTANDREALVPIKNLTYSSLSGVSIPARIKIGKSFFIDDDLLFTHKGVSGPVILKASLYFEKNETISIDLLPHEKITDLLNQHPKKLIENTLSLAFPNRLGAFILAQKEIRNLPNNQLSKKEINGIEEFIHRHQLLYLENEGYKKAEVMKGGVLVSKLTRGLESRKIRGLYFIGETVDVTGLLGGFNFQWAWSSAFSCALDINQKMNKTGQEF